MLWDKEAVEQTKNHSKKPIFQVEPARTRQKICTPSSMTFATEDLSTIPSALASAELEALAEGGHQEKPG